MQSAPVFKHLPDSKTLPQPPGSELAAPHFVRPGSIFDLLNFRMSELLNLSGSLVTRMCEGEFGVTRNEWALMAMMAALGPRSPSELARHTTIDRSQASKTLKILQAKGLALREPLPHDRRRAQIRLTARGTTLFEALFPRAVAINQAVLAVLNEEEQRQLADFLARMHRQAQGVSASGLVDARANRRRGGSRVRWRG